jgi:hypothetical protein
MSKLTVGDRVKYIGQTRPSLEGREGFILEIDLNLCNAEVEFDTVIYSEGHTPECVNSTIKTIPIGKLELLSHGNVIDEAPRPTEEQEEIYSTIKDSGDRTKYPSGAVRDKRVSKGMYSLIPSNSLERIAQHYEAGRVKYSDANNPRMAEENWKKGMYLVDFYDSAKRHIEKWKMGEYDEDHLAAACWNLLNLMETERRIKLGIYSIVLDNRDPMEFKNPRDLYDNEPHSLRIITGEVCKVKENNGT